MPALSVLLARGRCTTLTDHHEPLATLCQLSGIARQTDWPIAPISLQAEGIAPEQHYWLRADPVHLRPARDQLQLIDSAAFELTADEARQFAQLFNAHFGTQGYQLLTPHPKRWYLRSPLAHSIRTHSLNQATGKSINRTLPSGSDAMLWHRLFNEIQMLFFEHPINLAREARGQLPINSVWFWGGGVLPVPPHGNEIEVWCNDADMQALAVFTHARCQSVPEHANVDPPPHIVVLDALEDSGQNRCTGFMSPHPDPHAALAHSSSGFAAPLATRFIN